MLPSLEKVCLHQINQINLTLSSSLSYIMPSFIIRSFFFFCAISSISNGFYYAFVIKPIIFIFVYLYMFLYLLFSV